MDKKWISVRQYAKQVGKSRQQIYMDIRTGKLPKEKWRRKELSFKRLQILDS